MSTQHRPNPTSMPLVPARLPEPPPAALELMDVDSRVGWVEGQRIGFRGFGSEAEAAHAAWVAHRTLSRRLALRAGRRPIPVDMERLELDPARDGERILAGGQPIATLLRPVAGSRSGPDGFGFELRVPELADETAVRATAYVLYRTLRRSGVRWAMWARARRSAPGAGERGAAPSAWLPPVSLPPASLPSTSTRWLGGGGAANPPGWTTIGLSAALAIMMIAVVAGPAVTLPAIVSMLGGAAALLALAALASLGRMIVSDLLGHPARRRAGTDAGRPPRSATPPPPREAPVGRHGISPAAGSSR